ncbi:hypothetical protein F441_10395, partial [Phytophthora nicotianae CJ01A1]
MAETCHLVESASHTTGCFQQGQVKGTQTSSEGDTRDLIAAQQAAEQHPRAEGKWKATISKASTKRHPSDSILQDESDDEVGDDDLVVNVDGESDDGGAVELDKVPVAFELTRGGLDRLQAEEWDVYMEQEAGRVLHDALPLYDRPSDPTRAALAYAEDHLPSVTSSCSRNSGGALEWKRTSIAETALMPLPKQMRFRVLQRRETAPSTSGLSVEEYQTKLARKSAVQPHEN